MWFCKLGFIYGTYMLVVYTFSCCSSIILDQPVSEVIDRKKWTNSTVCSFPWLKSVNCFISGEVCTLLFVLQQSETFRTCKNKHWMDWRWFVQHLETVAYRGRGVWGFKRHPPPPNFRSFDKAEPNSQFRRKYIRNKLIRIRVSLIRIEWNPWLGD
jgi:hypothetical protein